MALKEGRCINCGSILFLEPKNEKGHCLFCDAVFDNSEAFRAQQEPEQFAFPNDPQPKYEGPSLDPRPSVVSAPAPTHRPATQKKAAPAFVPKVTEIPDARIPRKAKIIAIGVLLAVLAIFAAILVPLIMRRDTQRKVIQAALEPKLSGVTWDKQVSVLNFDNDSIIIALPEGADEAEATTLFDAYWTARAEAVGADLSAPEDGVQMRLVTPEGGYLIRSSGGEAVVTPFD